MTHAHRFFVMLAAVCSLAASPLFAQGFTTKLARTGLTQDDVNIMVAEGAQLYQNGGATVGSDTVWKNPETGAYGLAEVVEVEANCVRVAYRFRTDRNRTLQTVEIRRCLQDGTWVLAG